MSDGYTKLFASILDSSIWFEENPTRLVWITMLAMANRDGLVGAAVPGLAARARVTIAECEAAIAKFLAPDPYSRSAEHEGRRIERVDGGWRLLNARKHREKMSIEDRRERDASRKREERELHGQVRTDVDEPGQARTNADASESVLEVQQAEAEAEADPKAEAEPEKRESPRKRGSPIKRPMPERFCLTPAMAEYAKRKRSWLPEKIVEVFEDFVGKALARGYTYADWVRAWESWVRDEGKYDRPSGSHPVVPPDRASQSSPAFQRQLERIRQLEAEEKAS